MSSIENLFFEENLVSNLKVAAYFILLYEHFEDVVISTVKEFYSNPVVIDGKQFDTLDNGYIKILRNKVEAGEKGEFVPYKLRLREAEKSKAAYEMEVLGLASQGDFNEINDGKKIKGSLCWLQKHGVITDVERKRILSIRKRRNTLVHELYRILCEGLDTEDAEMIAELVAFNNRVNNWRFLQIEMPVMGITLPNGANPEDVISGDDAILQGLFRTLFCNEGDAFKDAFTKISGGAE